MYESPISLIVSDMEHQIRDEQERCILEAVQRVGVTVDKEGLVKALQYDRRQYESGYRAALLKFRDRLLGMVDDIAKELDDNA
jgi:hypothetical protein